MLPVERTLYAHLYTMGRGAPDGAHLRRGCKPLTRSKAAVPDAESRATRTLTR